MASASFIRTLPPGGRRPSFACEAWVASRRTMVSSSSRPGRPGDPVGRSLNGGHTGRSGAALKRRLQGGMGRVLTRSDEVRIKLSAVLQHGKDHLQELPGHGAEGHHFRFAPLAQGLVIGPEGRIVVD